MGACNSAYTYRFTSDKEGTALSGDAANIFSFSTEPHGINMAISTADAKVAAGKYAIFIEALSATGATAYKSLTLTVDDHPCTANEISLAEEAVKLVHID